MALATTTSAISPGQSITPGRLIDFSLRVLPSMQLPDGSFCLEVVRGGDGPIGRSPRYTLMTLLGLHRAAAAGCEIPFDLPTLTAHALGTPDPELTMGDYGLRAWLACRAEGDVERAAAELGAGCGDTALRDAEGMQLAWTVIGAGHALQHGCDVAAGVFTRAVDELIERRQTASGLIRQSGLGWRARFPNFATQIYSLLALAYVAQWERDPRAPEAARRLASVLIALQRPDRGWPWLFDVRRGAVVEPYQVYCVHQDAMAPMAFLQLAEALSDERYRTVAVESLQWIDGPNDIGRSLLDESEPMIYRSVRRRPPLNRLILYYNTAAALAGRSGLARYGGPVDINATDRPYHLGWILEAWCGRS